MVLETYGLVNDAWKHTSKLIFNEPIGDLKDYDSYLKEPLVGKKVKSIFSNKNIFVTSNNYSKNAKFFDYEHEMDKTNEILSKPIDVNKIKDIDSLFEAVNEKIIYSGNKILGNCKNVEDSDNITDSSYILNSSMIVNGKYIAYSYLLRKSEYSFASTSSGDSTMMIRCFYNNSLRRCFECITTVNSSDCYFCHNVSDSSDCLFTFNQRVKRNMIGNIQLTKEQYKELKSKLLSEIVTDLKTKKKTHSLLDVLGEQGE